MAMEIKDANFEAEVLKFKEPVLVDFWASWCGPCQILAPVIGEIAKDYQGKVKVVKMNVEENDVTPQKYNILSLPTLILFKGGKIIDQMVGAQSKEEIAKALDKNL